MHKTFSIENIAQRKVYSVTTQPLTKRWNKEEFFFEHLNQVFRIMN